MELRTFEAGNVTFVVKELHTRNGDGMSVGVRSHQSLGDVLIIRFDWFPDCPHYHYNPGQPQGREIPLDSALLGDTVDWFLDRLPDRLPAMIDRAGFPAIAQAVDTGAVRGVMAQVKRAAKDIASAVRPVS